jgi:hypothetical protein
MSLRSFLLALLVGIDIIQQLIQLRLQLVRLFFVGLSIPLVALFLMLVCADVVLYLFQLLLQLGSFFLVRPQIAFIIIGRRSRGGATVNGSLPQRDRLQDRAAARRDSVFQALHEEPDGRLPRFHPPPG